MVNSTILQGRLVRDPELSTTPSGVEICRFTVAWSEKYKDKESQLFLNCNAWRQTGVFINQYFKKGQEIVVQGRLETNSYTDTSGGNKSITQLVVDKVSFCGKKECNTNGQANMSVSAQTTASAPVQQNIGNLSDYEEVETNDEDLPF